MILSKASLAIEKIANVDDGPCTITQDGAIAGSARRAAMVVTPLEEKQRDAVAKVLPPQKLKGETNLAARTIRDMDKLIPKDSTFKGLLEYCDVTDLGDDGVEVTSTDGHRVQSIRARRARKRVDVGAVMRAMVEVVTTRHVATFVVNRKRLMALLDALNRACPDSASASPVWVSIGDDGDVVLRAENRATGQRAWALMSSGNAKESPPLGEWEQAQGHDEQRQRWVARKAQKSGKRKRFRE